ncbi:MAG: ribose-5-phosphate isomerase RpiA [Anaerolineales bacterium]|nr:ribose-5-phosphate isomerase RpiA [Anaerolineales bacterium]
MTSQQDALKRLAAEAAVQQIKSGMVVGLGFGSTAVHALRALGQKIQSGELEQVFGVPTAASIEQAASEAGIPLTTLEVHPEIDLTIDGADEVDPKLNLIKGGGGALLREKIVAQASLRLVIVVDESKMSDQLGSLFKLPVEVNPFGWGSQARFLDQLGATVELRLGQDGSAYCTENGNFILDCDFGEIDDPERLARQLEGRAGIAEHGLFLGLADEVIVGTQDGPQSLKR